MSDMLQLVVWMEVSNVRADKQDHSLSVGNLDDKLKHVGH